jgi:hypothetical protein
MLWFRVFVHTEFRKVTPQFASPVSASFPLLPSTSSTLFFSKTCSHTDTTATSQTFAYQSLPHCFHRDGGGTPSTHLLPYLSPSRDEKPVTVTLLESALTNRDARNSFRICSYTNCRVTSFKPNIFLFPPPAVVFLSLNSVLSANSALILVFVLTDHCPRITAHSPFGGTRNRLHWKVEQQAAAPIVRPAQEPCPNFSHRSSLLAAPMWASPRSSTV